MSSSDWSNLEELAALCAGILTSLFTLVFVLMGILWSRTGDLDKKIDEAEDESKKYAKDGDDKLWSAVRDKEDADRKFRENMIGRVSVLPNKEDYREMEARLTQAIQNIPRIPAKV